jgi:nitrogen fixation NifU-like protein
MATDPAEKPTPDLADPKNLGGFGEDEANVFTGIVGAPECGDVMRLQLKIDDAGVIEDARFKTFGCNSAVASSSYITELLKGMHVGDAGEVRTTQMVEELSLPPARIHCSVLAQDAVKAAIQDWKQRRRENEKDQSPDGAGE